MKITGPFAQGAKLFFGASLLVLLSACGSGAVSSSSDPTIAFSISPSTVTAFSGVPTTLTLSGGGLRAPFLIVTSNAAVAPVTVSSTNDTQFVITPGQVTSQQSATITVSDAAGKQATASLTVMPNLVNGDITITGTAPPAFANCATAGAICAGQSGTATLTISQAGAPAGGRSVRFDVVQGAFQFPVDVAQTVFANSLTVTSDSAGKVNAVLRANANASPQIATIRATDVATGAFRTATFIIKQPTINGGEFVTVPPEWTINGAFKSVCPGGTVDYLIFGGTPPYAIRSSAPLTATVYPSVTPNENPSRFSVVFLSGACGTEGYDALMTITDSAGLSITAKLTVKPGTADVPTPPAITLSSSSVTLFCNQSAQVLATLVNAGTTPPAITTSIATQTCGNNALTVTPPANGVITITRGSGLVGTTAACPNSFNPDASPATANITIGAGSAPAQTLTVNTQKGCP